MYRTFTFFGLTFQLDSIISLLSTTQSYNPIYAETFMVWAFPISLAAT